MNDTELKKILNIVFENKVDLSNFEDFEISNPIEWDSLANLNILMEIENAKGIKFNIDDFETITSVKSIKKYFNNG